MLSTTVIRTRTAAHVIRATKLYGSGDTAVRALNEVTVEFPSEAFTAIMGPSGSGKSTLMHCAAGLDTLTSGQAFIGEVELGSLSDKQLTLLRRERIGFVFQAFNLVPTLTALENITLPLALAGRRPDPDWLAGVIETVGVGDRLSHRPPELSGGQQQRVAIARALASRPQIVFADEPTGNLDSKTSQEILVELQRLNRDLGQTIIMVTHENDVAAYASRLVIIRDGLVANDSFVDPAALETRNLSVATTPFLSPSANGLSSGLPAAPDAAKSPNKGMFQRPGSSVTK